MDMNTDLIIHFVGGSCNFKEKVQLERHTTVTLTVEFICLCGRKILEWSCHLPAAERSVVSFVCIHVRKCYAGRISVCSQWFSTQGFLWVEADGEHNAPLGRHSVSHWGLCGRPNFVFSVVYSGGQGIKNLSCVSPAKSWKAVSIIFSAL